MGYWDKPPAKLFAHTSIEISKIVKFILAANTASSPNKAPKIIPIVNPPIKAKGDFKYTSFKEVLLGRLKSGAGFLVIKIGTNPNEIKTDANTYK